MIETQRLAEDDQAGNARIAALMRQNAALRASAVSMADYADRVAAQVGSVLGSSHHEAAAGWYMHFLEQRIEDMRNQVKAANAAADGIERVLSTSAGVDLTDYLSSPPLQTDSVMVPPVASPALLDEPLVNQAAAARAAAAASVAKAAAEQAVAWPFGLPPPRLAPWAAPGTPAAQRALSVRFATEQPAGGEQPVGGNPPGVGMPCTYEIWQGLINEQVTASELAKEWEGHKPISVKRPKSGSSVNLASPRSLSPHARSPARMNHSPAASAQTSPKAGRSPLSRAELKAYDLERRARANDSHKRLVERQNSPRLWKSRVGEAMTPPHCAPVMGAGGGVPAPTPGDDGHGSPFKASIDAKDAELAAAMQALRRIDQEYDQRYRRPSLSHTSDRATTSSRHRHRPGNEVRKRASAADHLAVPSAAPQEIDVNVAVGGRNVE